MHLSEGLTRLGVDTKENNESKAYRMIQEFLKPDEEKLKKIVVPEEPKTSIENFNSD